MEWKRKKCCGFSNTPASHYQLEYLSLAWIQANKKRRLWSRNPPTFAPQLQIYDRMELGAVQWQLSHTPFQSQSLVCRKVMCFPRRNPPLLLLAHSFDEEAGKCTINTECGHIRFLFKTPPTSLSPPRVMNHQEEEISHPNLPQLIQTLDRPPHPSCLPAVWLLSTCWNTIRLLKKIKNKSRDWKSFFWFLASPSVFLSERPIQARKNSRCCRLYVFPSEHMDGNDFSIRLLRKNSDAAVHWWIKLKCST